MSEEHHYKLAITHLDNNELLHAQIHALLYIGEQLELGQGFNAQNIEKITDALK